MLWAALFAVYAATLGIDADAGGEQYGRAESHVLLSTWTTAEHGGVGLDRAYAERAWTVWSDTPLRTNGKVVAGRLLEPHGVGFPAALAPAYALGGAKLVEVLLAAVAALAFVLAAALARRVVPDPWATRGALLAGISPPALGAATAVLPGLTAGALLAGACLCALAVRERPLMRWAFGGAVLLALLPWLDPWLLVPAAPVAVLLARWTARRGRGLIALGTLELQLASLVFFVSLNDRLFGGFTPLAVADAPATGAASTADYADRIGRLGELAIGREVGLVRWAPVFALVVLGAWLLWRSRRERLARLVADQRDAEHAAFLALAVVAAQVAVAAFALRSVGPASLVAVLPPAVAPIAWALRHAPRAGAALGGLTLVASGWLVLGLWLDGGGWAAPERAPWGAANAIFPTDPWVALGAAAAFAGAWIAALEWRRRRDRVLSGPG